MRGRILLTVAMLAAAFSGTLAENTADASDPYAAFQVWSYNNQMNRPWHSGYNNLGYGQPLALVVPPTVTHRQTFSWGVSQNLMYPVPHQYGRNATQPGAAAPGTFRHTPSWPSHTDQFGVNYVRGPWR